MRKIKLSLFIFFVAFFCSCKQPESDRLIFGKESAELVLKEALSENPGHNFIDHRRIIIADSATAASIAEPILCSIYGKDNILRQKPYEIYLIENYWVVSGTLPKDMHGGTFLMIIDSRDGKIIKLTHGQ